MLRNEEAQHQHRSHPPFWLPGMPFPLAAMPKSPSFLSGSQWMWSKTKGLSSGRYSVVYPSSKAPSKHRDQSEAAGIPLSAEQSSPVMYSLNSAALTGSSHPGRDPGMDFSTGGAEIPYSLLFVFRLLHTWKYIYFWLMGGGGWEASIYFPSFQGK